MTYLVIHNLLSRIPLEPCWPKLISITLYFYIQWTLHIVYVCGRTKHCSLKVATLAQGDSIMVDTQRGCPLCVKTVWSSALPSYQPRALCCEQESIWSSLCVSSQSPLMHVCLGCLLSVSLFLPSKLEQWRMIKIMSIATNADQSLLSCPSNWWVYLLILLLTTLTTTGWFLLSLWF